MEECYSWYLNYDAIILCGIWPHFPLRGNRFVLYTIYLYNNYFRTDMLSLLLWCTYKTTRESLAFYHLHFGYRYSVVTKSCQIPKSSICVQNYPIALTFDKFLCSTATKAPGNVQVIQWFKMTNIQILRQDFTMKRVVKSQEMVMWNS